MSNDLTPYTPRGPVSIIDGVRLGREARAANAALERLQVNHGLQEVANALADVRQHNAQNRQHSMLLIQQKQSAERTGQAIHLASGLFDLTVSQIGGDAAKAAYLQPLLADGVDDLRRHR